MKSDRQEQIIRLIREQEIETQEDLAEKLNELGFRVTQATVSRDIRQLQLTKVAGKSGRAHYILPVIQGGGNMEKYSRILKDALLSMDVAGNLVVLKTVPGMAMAAAAALDEMNLPEIVGCIAGDNTIMCAVRTQRDAEHVMRRLSEH